METSILIAYATRYGSTAEVAAAVGSRLRELGYEADVVPARDVRSLTGYAAVLLAAPFYIGSLLKDAQSFLTGHRAGLERLPVALLTLGPVRATDDLVEARRQIDRALGKFAWLEPVAAEMFVGKYDPSLLRFPDSLVAKAKPSPLYGVPATDDRDWDAIRAWAEGLPALFGLQ